MPVYTDFDYLLTRQYDQYNQPTGYWNWKTISTFSLSPGGDGNYHVTYSYIGSTGDIPYHNGTGNADIQKGYDHLATVSSSLQSVINSILNPTGDYSAFFSDVSKLTFEAPTSGRGMIDIGADNNTGSGFPTVPYTVIDRTDP